MAFGFSNIKGIFASSPTGEGVVGIDIGSSSIKVVQIKELRGKPTLVTYGELQLGPYANIEIGRSTNLEGTRITEALVDIIREASVTSSYVALAIPYVSSFVTVINLPHTDKEQLPAMVPIEARKYIPVPIHEVTLDWSVIPDKVNTNNTRVLLAAIHNGALQRSTTILKDAKLQTQFTEIEVFSTIRSSVPNSDQSVMLLDLGAATTKLYIVSEGVIEKTHSIAHGAEDLTQSLKDTFSITLEEAEELKRAVGLSDTEDGRIATALVSSLERIFRESFITLQRYETEYKKTVAQIILTGGGSVLKGLEEQAGTAFGRTTVVADPFDKVVYPAFLKETLKTAGPSFAVAMGVALRLLK